MGPDVILETDVVVSLTGISASQFGAKQEAAFTKALQSALQPYNIESVAIQNVTV